MSKRIEKEFGLLKGILMIYLFLMMILHTGHNVTWLYYATLIGVLFVSFKEEKKNEQED